MTTTDAQSATDNLGQKIAIGDYVAFAPRWGEAKKCPRVCLGWVTKIEYFEVGPDSVTVLRSDNQSYVTSSLNVVKINDR